MNKKLIYNSILFLYMVLFLYTGISKIIDHDSFYVTLRKSPLLSNYASIVTWTIPPLEIAIATFLIITRWQYYALYASFALMVLFTLYIGFILTFSESLPCSCGGIIQKLSWRDHLLFNLMFIALAIIAIKLHHHNERVSVT